MKEREYWEREREKKEEKIILKLIERMGKMDTEKEAKKRKIYWVINSEWEKKYWEKKLR